LFLALATVAAKIGLERWTTRITTPSMHAVKADEFRAMARGCEEEARALRAFASTGKSGTPTPGGVPYSPRAGLRQAALSDRKAAGFRNLADIEECQNLGVPVP
jgi:hypothetical protein